jgi:hypothetical protein
MTDEPYPTPGKPYAIESYYSEEFRKRWKLVRNDDMTDIPHSPGRIITADEASGRYCISVPDGNNGWTPTAFEMPPFSFKIVFWRR